jgi:hypothetical protein
MSVYDNPNQQVVRPDGSGPADSGAGGSGGDAAAAPPTTTELDLEAATKEELLAYAIELGVSPANAGMTKDELKAGIEQAQRR